MLSSKILRVHKDGTVPTDNPFYDGEGANNDLIWARGFRNPFRIRFEPGTGKLWVNVAGEAAEQIFRVGRGDHAGWWQYENNQPDGFLSPLVAYTPGFWELQALQISPATTFELDEGMGGTFTVALAYAPMSPVTVAVAHTSGSEDVSVTAGATLTFMPEDGTTAKTVTFATARATDSEDDVAVLTLSAPGLAARTVTVIARDVAGWPAITSVPVTQAAVGTPYEYTVTATGRPVPSLVLVQGPQGMTLDPTSGRLSWTPATEATVTVSLRASNGLLAGLIWKRQRFRNGRP